jgi:putative pyruvate formate lyase activating enzyme
MDFLQLYSDCNLCPRGCGVDRLGRHGEPKKGFCGERARIRVAYIGPHFGEEPPISGERGSGTIFFSGCTLQCTFCQNYQISREGLGRPMDVDGLVAEALGMIETHGVHNINLVTPDHFFPHVFQCVTSLREQGCSLPFVYNLSGYQSLSMLRMAAPYADLYLPDFKYADAELARRLSGCRDYPGVALDALSEMLRQKGFLDVCKNENRVAQRGVLVRHLILPGELENSIAVLTTLFLEFGPGLPVSIMSQYHPARPMKDEALNRPLTPAEFDPVYSHALDLGFENLFVQFPEQEPGGTTHVSPFLPDFRLDKPFSPKNHPNPDY